jgi:DNA-binding response OmpR family regulator
VPVTGKPVTLLVVDDEEPIHKALRRFLVQQGFEVTTAASREEAHVAGVARRQARVFLDDARV